MFHKGEGLRPVTRANKFRTGMTTEQSDAKPFETQIEGDCRILTLNGARAQLPDIKQIQKEVANQD